MLFKKICQYGAATILSIAIVCAVLKRYVWSGFSYVVLGLLSVLALLWAAYFVYDYFTRYRAELNEDYEDFKVRTINKENITVEQYKESEYSYKKQFKKSCFKDKFVKWCVVLVCIAIAAGFIISMFLI